MNKHTLATLLVSTVIGAAITLISGHIQTPTPQLGIDVVYWGIPLSWTMRVIPTRFQSIDWINLTLDLLIWTSILFIASTGANLFIIRKLNPKTDR